MTSHDPITPRARELFERASTGLDQGTAFRLRRARQEALQSRPRPRFAAMMVPAGALSAAVLALGFAWWMPQQSSLPGPALAGATSSAEIDALVADEDPELYAWLAEAPVATAGPGARR